MIRSLPLLLLAASPAMAEETESYAPSPAQERVDRSFSDIPIETPFESVKDRLTEIVQNDCQKWGECEWRDADGVRHYFWGDGPESLYVVLKFVRAGEFEGRSIGAFGIGLARDKEAVIAAVKRFVPGIELDCDPANASGNVGPDECSASLDPGWFQIGFDSKGQLETIRFDGYHFT